MIKWMPVVSLAVFAVLSVALHRDLSSSVYMSAAVICFYLGRLK